MFATDAGGVLDPAVFERQMTVNLAAPIFLAQAFAAVLPDGVEGNVVNLLDQSVWKPTPRHFSYQLSKVALWEATKMLAQSLAPRVRVNAISPGPTLKHAGADRGGIRRADRHDPAQARPDPDRVWQHHPLPR